MENVNFNFASEQESYEGWNEYNEERESEEFTAAKIAELKNMVFRAAIWKTGEAIA